MKNIKLLGIFLSISFYAIANKNILLTGANGGIGSAIAHLILKKHPSTKLIFTYRSKESGLKALSELQKSFPKIKLYNHQLDVSNENSVEQFAKWSKKEFKKLDVIINNAGVAHKRSPIEKLLADTINTFDVNYFGLKNITKALHDQIADGGKVINVSSDMAKVLKMRKTLKDKFLDSSITEQQLDELVHKFINNTKENQLEKEGWNEIAYSVSKLAVNSWTRICARDEKRNIAHIAVDPGWCQTRMGGTRATRTPEEGAESILAGVYGDASEMNGGFFFEGQSQPW